MAERHGRVEYLTPEALHPNPAFTHVVTISGPVKTVWIGAQVAVDRAGHLVGKGDIAAQTRQILDNIDACLAAAGAQREHLIHWSIQVAQGQDMQPSVQVALQWWGNRPHPPMNNVFYVSGFWPADFLLSIEAVAAVPQTETPP